MCTKRKDHSLCITKFVAAFADVLKRNPLLVIV
jgi:hypothetical protein